MMGLRISDLVKASISSTLAATAIATAAGTGAWLFGIARAIWPDHPLIAVFVITIVVSIVVKQIWHVPAGQKRA
jgi:hypothetical protein